MSLMIPAESETELRDLVGQAVLAIERRSGRVVESNSLRARLGRVLRRATLDDVLAAVAAAPRGYGPPMLVRWCEKRTEPPPAPKIPALDPLSSITDELVHLLEGRPSDEITTTLHPRINSTTSVVVGQVAFNAIRRARFGDAPEDGVTNRLRTLHTLTSIGLEATSATPTVVDQAVAVGATWEQIGAALGVGEATARIRYER